jgi:hypothetical protein
MLDPAKHSDPGNRRIVLAIGGLIAAVAVVGFCLIVMAIQFWHFQP